MEAPYRLTGGEAAFILISLAPVMGAAYAWWQWRAGYALKDISRRRRPIAIIGLSLVSLQALLFPVFWLAANSDPSSLANRAYRLYPVFLLAVPCLLAGRGASRWLLLASSLLLFGMYHYLIFSTY